MTTDTDTGVGAHADARIPGPVLDADMVRTARGGRRGPRTPIGRWVDRTPWPMPASALAHLAMLAILLPHLAPRQGGSPQAPATIEIEMVDQDARQVGDAPAEAASTEAAPQQAQAEAQDQPAEDRPAPRAEQRQAMPASAVPMPPTPRRASEQLLMPPLPVGAGGVPMPLPYVPPGAEPGLLPEVPTPPVPAPRPPAQPAATPANLGNGDQVRTSLLVQGDNVVPPKPDSRHRNKPPDYPAEAARRHVQGTVDLLVRVTTEGKPGTIRIVRSSGVPSLDRAAADAVRTWQFTPAQRGGVAVAFDYPISIKFAIGSS